MLMASGTKPCPKPFSSRLFPSPLFGRQLVELPRESGDGASTDGVLRLANKVSSTTVENILDAASSNDPSEKTVRVNEDTLEDVLLFVGILSGRGYRHRRLAVREAWANQCQKPGVSVCRFMLSEDEVTPQVSKEVEEHGDIVLVREKTNYKSILLKTFFVLEYAIKHYDVRFILKTDDDAYVHVEALVHQLRLLCISPDCRNERLYMGRMCTESEVLLQPGHKWNNIVFYNHTGLKTYPNYMMGGGYILSGDVSKMLLDINAKLHLKFTPIEDATLGFWLMSMDLRHVDHPKMYTYAVPCCFKAPVRKEGQRIVTRFQLQDDIEEEICSNDPWIILHKIDSPTKMRYIGSKVASCNKTLDSTAVAPSIAAWVKQKEVHAQEEIKTPTEIVLAKRRQRVLH
ncbi:g6216 [Coccomyxa viridis]|uniref:Hexosyltransferase n=1 Tax=Coccomyxa viridis TaxID=1274662 RepID=A0ABP1FUV7_9CHLO